MTTNRPKNILIVRFSALGDVAMTIPAIYDVASTYPAHRFHVLTTRFCAQLFVNAPSNVTLIPVEDTSVIRVLQQLRKLQIDKVADLHNVLKSWLIDLYYLLHGKPVAMVDKMRRERRGILRKHKFSKRPFVLRYFDVFRRLNLPTNPVFTTLFKENPPTLPLKLQKSGETKWIGIAPFARYSNKIYPQKQMYQVVSLLQENENVEIFLFGSKGNEAEILHQWAGRLPRVHVVAGKAALKEELAIMSHLDVMLTMDSANMHMASIAGAKVVSIWGGTTPACGFTPWNQEAKNAISKGLPCQPCTIAGKNHCPDQTFACMNQLLPSEIASKIISLL